MDLLYVKPEKPTDIDTFHSSIHVKTEKVAFPQAQSYCDFYMIVIGLTTWCHLSWALSINQLNFYSANIPGEPGPLVRQTKSVFNSKIDQAVP